MFQAKELENQYGILVVEPDEETDTAQPDNAHLFCVVYYPAIRNISAKENATKVPLRSIVDIGTVNSCEDDEGLNVVKDMFGYINGSSHIGNCSIAERAKRLEHYQARGLISDRIVSNKYNGSDYNITIEVMSLVERNAKERILKFNQTYPEGHFYVYSYDSGDDKSFDPSLVVILVMAVGTVILGSFWSGHVKNNLRLKKEVLSSLERREDERECIEPQDGSGGADEELSVHVSPLLVMFFVFCMCSMLVLLYFFFNQLGKTADYNEFSKTHFYHYYSLGHLRYVLHRLQPGHVQLPGAPGDGELQCVLAASAETAQVQSLPLHPPAGAQTVPPAGRQHCHLRHLVRLQEERVVLDPAGYSGDHVQY